MKRRYRSLISGLLVLAAACSQAFATGGVDLSAQWHKTGADIVSGFRNMYQPNVIYEPESEYPYRMWFFGWAADDCNSGWSGCDAIYHARAKNLKEWEVYAGEAKWDTAMEPSKWVPVVIPGTLFFDSWHNGDPSVVKKDGVYYMAFSSTGHNRDRIPDGHPGDVDGDISCVMGATSPDGIHWTKTKRPILINRADIGARGGYVAGGMYLRPSLMFDQGKWRCWFDYWTGSSLAMGYAECSEDGFLDPAAWRVVRAGEQPLLDNFPNPAVVRVGSRYYAYSDPAGFGQGWPGRRICEAVSGDGINWRVLGHILPESDTPATHVPEPLVVKEGGRTKIVVFYSCQVGGEPYDFRYNRIRYMWRYEGE